MNQNTLNDPTTPQLDNIHFHAPVVADFNLNLSTTPPKILLLYGSLRETSYSRKVVEESARILRTCSQSFQQQSDESEIGKLKA